MAFTREDYMRGLEPPKPDAELPILWHYGVLKAQDGTLRAFWTRGAVVGLAIARKQLLAPPNSTLAREKAEALLAKLQKEGEPGRLTPGTLCTHNDGGGHHMALIVGVVEDKAYAVFLTSTQNWNAYVRPASLEEFRLLGGRGDRPTWLAPVVRPLSEFYAGRGQVDYQVIKAYQIEFMRAYHSKRV